MTNASQTQAAQQTMVASMTRALWSSITGTAFSMVLAASIAESAFNGSRLAGIMLLLVGFGLLMNGRSIHVIATVLRQAQAPVPRRAGWVRMLCCVVAPVVIACGIWALIWAPGTAIAITAP